MSITILVRGNVYLINETVCTQLGASTGWALVRVIIGISRGLDAIIDIRFKALDVFTPEGL